jgi:hypothetical protein
MGRLSRRTYVHKMVALGLTALRANPARLGFDQIRLCAADVCHKTKHRYLGVVSRKGWNRTQGHHAAVRRLFG